MARTKLVAGFVIFILVCAVVLLLFLPRSTRSTETTNAERVTNVKVMEVTPVFLKEWIELPASVEPYVLTKVAAEVEGRVDWIGLDDGDTIAKPGVELLRIDQRSFQAQYEEAQAAYKLSQRNCKRIEDLHAQGIMSDEQLDQCRTKVATDGARLEIMKVQLDKATVRAPIAGVLNKVYVEVGEYVRQGEHLADIVVLDPVKILVKVPEKEIPYLHLGDKAQILSKILEDKSYEGTVSYVSMVGDSATRTYNVEITVPNPQREILPSMIATMKILKREIPDAIIIPLFSVIPRGDFSAVFVEKNGKAEERLVKLGILEGSSVQIVSGLEPHDRLIVEGHRELTSGEAVRVQGSPEASS